MPGNKKMVFPRGSDSFISSFAMVKDFQMKDRIKEVQIKVLFRNKQILNQYFYVAESGKAVFAGMNGYSVVLPQIGNRLGI